MNMRWWSVLSLIAMLAGHSLTAIGTHNEPLQNGDDMLSGGSGGPAPIHWNYTLRYSTSLTGQLQFSETGVNDFVMNCPYEWTVTETQSTAIDLAYRQGYLFSYDHRLIRVFYDQDGIRRTYSHECLTADLLPRSYFDHGPASSCEAGFMLGGWEFLTRMPRVGKGDGDRVTVELDSVDLSEYSDLCVVFKRPHAAQLQEDEVPYTGRFRLIVTGNGEPAWRATWPNLLRGETVPVGFDVGHLRPPLSSDTMVNHQDPLIIVETLPLHLGPHELPRSGLGGIGHFLIEVYGWPI